MNYANNPAVKAALFDIDGTLTRGGDVWRPLVSSPDVSPLRKAWLYATGMPHYLLSQPGLLKQAGFRDRWVRLMAWLMTGWTVEQVDAVADRIVAEKLLPVLREDVVGLLHQHRAAGQPVVLVSTMFERISGRFAEQVGADVGLGSVVAMQAGRCTGRIEGDTCSGARKINFAWRYLAHHHPGVTLEACAAYADSASDVAFLNGVGYRVAVYPDDTMRAAAQANDWPVFEGPPS